MSTLAFEDIQQAASRLQGVAHRTPVVSSCQLDKLMGAEIFLKAESLQRTGSFKFRGAYNKSASLNEQETKPRGVVAVSSGNHAQAVALAARLFGFDAAVLMPSDAPESKVQATRGYGAEVLTFDRYRDNRDELGRNLSKQRGWALVPPFDDPFVMAGQGTAALELFEDVGALDLLVVPVGGGGLLAGCGTAARALSPSVRIIGVEPRTGDDTRRSLVHGSRIRIPVPRTIADGLQHDTPGLHTFEINRQIVDEVVVVSDVEIVQAMVFLFECFKLVVEPSGAVSLAVLLSHKINVQGQRVGIMISGGNIDADRFCIITATAADIGGAPPLYPTGTT